jgi:hypothetical protein
MMSMLNSFCLSGNMVGKHRSKNKKKKKVRDAAVRKNTEWTPRKAKPSACSRMIPPLATSPGVPTISRPGAIHKMRPYI